MIDVDFVVDYTGDEPEHKVRLTLGLQDLQELRHAIYSACWAHETQTHNAVEAIRCRSLHEFLGRVEKRVAGPSLFSLGDFRATSQKEKL